MTQLTNKEAILKFLSDKADIMDLNYSYYDVDTDIQSPENNEHTIIINGRIEAKIAHDSGCYHQGLGWEIIPHDYVADWEFEGRIEVINNNDEVIQQVNYQDLKTIF